MKVAVVHELGHPLVVDERSTPIPGAGQVLVKLEASGLCHTDIHAAHGDWPVKPEPPFVPGHEGVGIVHAHGPGVADSVLGTRVAVPWLHTACGHCEHCVSGWETLCLEQQNTGYTVDGCFGTYVRRRCELRRAGARGHRSARSGAVDVRRGHDLQGGQGVRCATVRRRRRVRHRRPRPPGGAVRQDRRRDRRRGRHR